MDTHLPSCRSRLDRDGAARPSRCSSRRCRPGWWTSSTRGTSIRGCSVCLTAASNLVPVAVLDMLAGRRRRPRDLSDRGLVAARRRRGVLDVAGEGLKRLIRACAVVALAFMLRVGLQLPPAAARDARSKAGPRRHRPKRCSSRPSTEAVALATQLRPGCADHALNGRGTGADARSSR